MWVAGATLGSFPSVFLGVSAGSWIRSRVASLPGAPRWDVEVATVSFLHWFCVHFDMLSILWGPLRPNLPAKETDSKMETWMMHARTLGRVLLRSVLCAWH